MRAGDGNGIQGEAATAARTARLEPGARADHAGRVRSVPSWFRLAAAPGAWQAARAALVRASQSARLAGVSRGGSGPRFERVARDGRAVRLTAAGRDFRRRLAAVGSPPAAGTFQPQRGE